MRLMWLGWFELRTACTTVWLSTEYNSSVISEEAHSSPRREEYLSDSLNRSDSLLFLYFFSLQRKTKRVALHYNDGICYK